MHYNKNAFNINWYNFKWDIIISDEKLQISCNNFKLSHFVMLSMHLSVLGLKFVLVTDYKLPFMVAFEAFVI